MYLGGLNKSLISYEVYRHNIIEHINYATCSSSDSQCNVTVENDYYDLRSGIIETFYVNLRIAEATSLMCQGYIAPHVIQSKSSSINVNDIVGKLLTIDVTINLIRTCMHARIKGMHLL